MICYNALAARRCGPGDSSLTAFFALTLFVSSFLLFLVEPLFARMVLPLLGGTPAVWNTCMVFFQFMLLAGYAYAHVVPAWLGPRRQALVHTGLLLVPLAVLPLSIAGWTPPAADSPVFALLGLLFLTVGLPFFVVSTTAPLLQKWFAQTGHAAAGDPYFLYVASNAGSMVALLAYPTLFEPFLPLEAHNQIWAGGYGLLIVLTTVCAVLLCRSPIVEAPADLPAAAPVSAGTRLRWLALAFVPSSLLLSVTTYLTTDIAAVPLLWVVPLALYLLTFILAFASKPLLPPAVLPRALPLTLLLIVLTMLAEAKEPVVLIMGLHLLGLFLVGLICHGELARLRPPARHLTEFYLWLAAGGVLGGLFNALLAPLVFPGLVEYPLVLVLACLLIPHSDQGLRRRDLLGPLVLGGVTVLCLLLAGRLALPPGPLAVAAAFGIPVVLCYTFVDRPARFGLGLAALLLASLPFPGVHGRVEYRERSFFGIHRVTQDPEGAYRRLVHGDTVHGQESLDPQRRGEPLTYYYRSGPIGQLLRARQQSSVRTEAGSPRQVALVGLGAGSLLSYAQPGECWTVYEIDPAVKHIACELQPRLFTFWQDCPAPHEVVLGDARLKLAEADPGVYELIIIDAFSSDAIPIHLLTRQALDLYASRLAVGGILAFHISNNYLDLEPVLAALAAERGWTCLTQRDLELSKSALEAGKAPSQWMLLARRDADVAMVLKTAAWSRVPPRPGVRPWTDDFHNLLCVFRWRSRPKGSEEE
jgi:hypothetical protein